MIKKIEGKIAAILDTTTVVINRGRLDGVKIGDIFYIYSTIGPFSDPDTDEDLGTTARVWGKVETSIVADKFSVAKTPYDTSLTGFLAINLFRNTRIRLPVDETEISRGLERIKVGFSVVAERSSQRATVEEHPLLANESSETKDTKDEAHNSDDS